LRIATNLDYTAPMGWRLTSWPIRIATDPEGAKAEILAELHRSRGNAAAAARALGISIRSFWLYLDRLGLKDEHARIRALYANSKRRRKRVGRSR
jgi:hypothetical protein